eukprot:2081342-Prorocentrum_lima.AAC.1
MRQVRYSIPVQCTLLRGWKRQVRTMQAIEFGTPSKTECIDPSATPAGEGKHHAAIEATTRA